MRPAAVDGSGTPASLVFSDDLSSRLQREGAKTGDVQRCFGTSLNDRSSLPGSERRRDFFRANRHSRSGGELDVDMNASFEHMSDRPVENIYWPAGGCRRAITGLRRMLLCVNYSSDPTDFRCEVGGKARCKNFPVAQLRQSQTPGIRILPWSIRAGNKHGPGIRSCRHWTALPAVGLVRVAIGQTITAPKTAIVSRRQPLLLGAIVAGMTAGRCRSGAVCGDWVARRCRADCAHDGVGAARRIAGSRGCFVHSKS